MLAWNNGLELSNGIRISESFDLQINDFSGSNWMRQSSFKLNECSNLEGRPITKTFSLTSFQDKLLSKVNLIVLISEKVWESFLDSNQ